MNRTLWPRRNAFHTHFWSPPTPKTWSVSSRLAFLPSTARGSGLQVGPLVRARGEPVRGAREHLVVVLRAVAGESHRVLLRFRLLVGVHCIDDEVVPVLVTSLVRHFVEHVVEVVQCVHDLADVGGLPLADARVVEGW